MTSERLIGQALLESDFVNPNFFYLLAKEDKKTLKSCNLRIPPTALFEQGFAKALFTTEILKGAPQNSGEVKKKVGRDVDSQEVYETMTKGVPDRAVCAVLIFAAHPAQSNAGPSSPSLGSTTGSLPGSGGGTGHELTRVRFMDREEVRQFIFHELEKPKCIMQRFVVPKGNNNSVILATWSPLLCLTEGRRSTFSLLDRHVTPNQRGLTFEDASATTLPVAISPSVIKEITACCNTIVEHFDRTERLTLSRLTAMFKVDNTNMLTLLYSTSIRIQDPVVQNHEPVSLDAGVHVAEFKAKSLVQRFQGLGARQFRDSQDPLEWMDTALHQAEEKEHKMVISVAPIGNASAMILDEVRSRSHRSRSTALSPGRSVSRGGIATRSSNVSTPTLRSPQQSRRSPTGRAASPLAPPSPISEALAPRSAAGSKPPPSQHLSSAGNQSFPSASVVPPSASYEGQFLTVAPGAPLPQPRQLLKYQHVLPNSITNMNSQVQLHALGTNEEAIRGEWETFLAQQIRDIRRIRIVQASSTGNATGGGVAAHDLHQSSSDIGGDAASNRAGVARDATQRTRTPPPPKHHATFGGSADSVGRERSQSILGDEKDIAKLSAMSHATLKAAKDMAALREKETFMDEMRNEVARRALQTTMKKGKAEGDGAAMGGQQGGEDAEITVSDNDDPRFFYMSRDMRPQLSIPDGFAATRSTLLPPVFTTAGDLQRGGATSTSSTTGAGGANGKRSLTDRPSPSRKGGKSSSEKAHTGVSPLKSNPKAQPDVSPPSGPTPSPQAHRSSSPTSPVKSSGHAAKPASPRSSHGISAGHTISHPTPSKAMEPASRLESSTLAPGRKDYVLECHKNFAHVPKLFDDFSALGDAAEVDRVLTHGAQICQLFSLFVQELHYSIHGAFLNRTLTNMAYIEVPVMFQGVVSMPTLSRILHKLHGSVVPRSRVLMEHPSSPAMVILANGGSRAAAEDEAVRWRADLLKALQSVSLQDFAFENVTSWKQIESCEAVYLKHGATQAQGEERPSPQDGSPERQRRLLQAATEVDAAAPTPSPLCIVVPLLSGSMGLEILRAESFFVEADLKAFINHDNGIIFHQALQYAYYTRIAEIKGEQAALLERQQNQQLQAAEAAAVAAAKSSSLLIQSDDNEDEAGSLTPHSPNRKLQVRTPQEQGLAPIAASMMLSVSSKTGSGAAAPLTPQTSRQKSASKGAPSGVSETGADAYDQEAALQSQMADMMCPKCKVCRVCCVCKLMATPSASPARSVGKGHKGSPPLAPASPVRIPRRV